MLFYDLFRRVEKFCYRFEIESFSSGFIIDDTNKSVMFIYPVDKAFQLYGSVVSDRYVFMYGKFRSYIGKRSKGTVFFRSFVNQFENDFPSQVIIPG